MATFRLYSIARALSATPACTVKAADGTVVYGPSGADVTAVEGTGNYQFDSAEIPLDDAGEFYGRLVWDDGVNDPVVEGVVRTAAALTVTPTFSSGDTVTPLFSSGS